MIRLRSQDGKVVTLPKQFVFVEIADSDGNVAALFIQDVDGSVKRIERTDDEAFVYASKYGVKWCPLVGLPTQYQPKPPTTH